MSENMRQYIVNVFVTEMRSILGAKANHIEVDVLANDAVADIDWNDSALMHKDMKWLASYFLQKRQLV